MNGLYEFHYYGTAGSFPFGKVSSALVIQLNCKFYTWQRIGIQDINMRQGIFHVSYFNKRNHDYPKMFSQYRKIYQNTSPFSFYKWKSLSILPLSHYIFIVLVEGKRSACLAFPGWGKSEKENHPPLIDTSWTSRLVE